MSLNKLVNSEYIPKHEVDADNALIDEGYNPQHLKIHNKSIDLQEIAKFRKKEKERKSMYRADGTLKSDRGFLGPITNNVTNGTMTEVSVSFEDVLDNMEIPLLVPGQSAEDLDWLMNNPIEGNAENFPQTMKDIAIEHALKRTEEGKNVFFNESDLFENSRAGEIFHNYKDENGVQLWAESAQRLFGDPDLFNKFYKPMDKNYDASPEEISEWALEFIARIDNNLIYSASHLRFFDDISNESKLDIYRLLNMYTTSADEDSDIGVPNLYHTKEREQGDKDNQLFGYMDPGTPQFDGIAWDGLSRAFRGILTDATTYGGGFAYHFAKGMAKRYGGKGVTKKIMEFILPKLVAGFEGSAYMSAYDYMNQEFQIEGQAKNPETFGGGEIPTDETNPFPTEINKESIGASAVMGFFLAPLIEAGFATPGAIDKQIQKIRKKNNIADDEPIEDMVILHNTGDEAILQYDELGGIPSPSLAVTKSDQVFEGFGDIQLIAKPKNFDPAEDPKNVIYGSDAYTPRMPRGVYTFLDNADDLIEADYRPLIDKYDINSQLNNANASIWDKDHNFRKFERPTFLTAIKFLDELGYEKEIREALDVDVKKIRDEKIKEYELRINDPNTRPDLIPELESLLEATKRGVNDRDPQMTKEMNIQRLLSDLGFEKERSWEEDEILEGIDFEKFLNNERAKYISPNKTFRTKNKQVQRRIDRLGELLNSPLVRRDQDLYEKYTLELEELEFGGSKWMDLPFTLNNILDNMLEEVQRGGEVGFGSGGPNKVKAVASKSYKSLDEVKADKDRILSPDEQLSQENAEAGKVIAEDGSFQGSEIDLGYNWGKLEKMVNRFSEGGVEPDQLYYSMIDAIRSDRSDEAIKEAFTYMGGDNFGPDEIQRVRNFIEILREAPVDYFEAKPQRVVYLDEFGGAIVHKNTDPKVIEILEKNGLEIIMEPPNMSGEKSYDASGYQDQLRPKLSKYFFTVPPAIVVGNEIIDENNRQEK